MSDVVDGGGVTQISRFMPNVESCVISMSVGEDGLSDGELSRDEKESVNGWSGSGSDRSK